MSSCSFLFPSMIYFIGFLAQVSLSDLCIVPDWGRVHGMTLPGLSNTLTQPFPVSEELMDQYFYIFLFPGLFSQVVQTKILSV